MTDLLIQGLKDTLYMTSLSAVLAYAVGMPLGIYLVISKKGGVVPNVVMNTALETIINIWRSIPFYVLMIVLIPVTRLLVGKAIGQTAVSISLFIGAVPFVARIVEQSLLEIDEGIIEACTVMGCTTMEIVIVLVRESIPSLIRGISITVIMLIGYSAMAGALGGGGLGDIANRYGLHRYDYGAMMITLVVIIVIVMIIQFTFNTIARKIDRKVR